MAQLEMAFHDLGGYMRSLQTTNSTCPSSCDTCVIDCVCKSSSECRNVVVLVFGIVFAIVVFILITGYFSWRVFKKNRKTRTKQTEYNFDNTAPNLNVSTYDPRNQSQLGAGYEEKVQEVPVQQYPPQEYNIQYKTSPRNFNSNYQENFAQNSFSQSEYPTRDAPQFGQQDPQSNYQSTVYAEQPRRAMNDTYEKKVSARNYQSPDNQAYRETQPYRENGSPYMEDDYEYRRNPNVMNFDKSLPPIILKPYEEDRI